MRCRYGEFGYIETGDPGVLLGADPNATYRDVAKLLRPGTTLVLYSDGLVETRSESVDHAM